MDACSRLAQTPLIPVKSSKVQSTPRAGKRHPRARSGLAPSSHTKSYDDTAHIVLTDYPWVSSYTPAKPSASARTHVPPEPNILTPRPCSGLQLPTCTSTPLRPTPCSRGLLEPTPLTRNRFLTIPTFLESLWVKGTDNSNWHQHTDHVGVCGN